MRKIYNFKFALATLGLMLFSIAGFAQSFKASGQFRPRFEYRHGYKTLAPSDAQAASFVSQRTRLNLQYSDKRFKAGFSLQNVRVWGDVTQLNKADVNGSAIHEAWGELYFNDKIALKVGRQEIVYDDHRIFGSVNWAQQARSHDAAILKIFPKERCELNIGVAYNQSDESLFNNVYLLNNYKSFQYLWYHRDFNKFGLSFLFLNNGVAYWDITDSLSPEQKIAYSQTIGPRLTYKGDLLSFDAAFYFQGGKQKPVNDTLSTNEDLIDLNAFYYTANIYYNLTRSVKVGLGFEFLSGNSQIGPTDKNKAFTPFYGTNHKFNGWMDYFYVGNHINSVGLLDIYLPINFKKNQFSAAIVPHSFHAANDIHDWNSTDPKASLERYLGFEVDISVGYAFSKSVRINAGYSQMFGSKSMDALKMVKDGSSQNNNWGWVMLVFNPVFLERTD